MKHKNSRLKCRRGVVRRARKMKVALLPRRVKFAVFGGFNREIRRRMLLPKNSLRGRRRTSPQGAVPLPRMPVYQRRRHEHEHVRRAAADILAFAAMALRLEARFAVGHVANFSAVASAFGFHG